MTQRARRRHRRSRGSPGKKILLGVVVVGTVIGIGATSAAIWVLDVWGSASIDDLHQIHDGATSVVYAADGSRLGFIQSDDIRQPVSLDNVPQDLEDATVAIEDENFYEHNGVDPSAIARAAVKDVEAGGAVQGGSTITQQLVRNLYIANPQETIERKIKEASLAVQLEDERSKHWILDHYLNTASYGTIEGRTAVGVQAASQLYFSKPVKDLDLPQAALLAGLPQAPSEYNPLQNPQAALNRRNDVLKAMAEQHYISHADYQEASGADLELDRGYKYSTIREPYFFDYVEQQLIEKYGVNTVRQGGLKVYTTIDPALQADAKSALDAQVATLGGPSAALVSIDPTNGHIVAMASSGDYQTNQYNLAAQGHRQAGSSFKTFVLTTAIEQGIDPYSTYYDGASPVTLTLPDGLTTWTVNNAEPGGGVMSLADATTHSVNAIYAQLDLDVGPEEVAQTAHSMGITSPLDGIPAEGIGGLRIGVSPLEMADAYATLAAGGIHHDPTAIAKVVHLNGDVDEPEQPEGNRVFSDGVAAEVTKVLKTVVTSGTGTNANFGCPAAGKTGTVDDFTDAWFVGYTPQFSTAVWVGYPNAKISMGYDAFGGTYAAPIWHDYMEVAHGSFCDDFPPPESPVSLESYTSDHTVSQPSKEQSSSEPAPPTSGSTQGKYPSLYYAPGAGQSAPPTPPSSGTDDGTP